MVAKKKSFSGYSGMWTTEDESEIKGLGVTDNLQETNNQVRQSDSNESNVNMNLLSQNAPNNFNANIDNNITSDVNVLDVEVKKKRGRPKLDNSEKKEHFNLLLKPEVRITLTKIAGRIQAETGERLTVTSLITQLIEDFIAKQKESSY